MCGSVQNIILLFTLSLQHIVRILCTACKVSTRIPTWPIFAKMCRIQSTLYGTESHNAMCLTWHFQSYKWTRSNISHDYQHHPWFIVWSDCQQCVPFLHKIGLKMQNNLWHVKRQWEYGMLLFLLLCKIKNMYHYATYFFNCLGSVRLKKKKKNFYSARIH